MTHREVRRCFARPRVGRRLDLGRVGERDTGRVDHGAHQWSAFRNWRTLYTTIGITSTNSTTARAAPKPFSL